ncbi:MAG: hypothetical protein ABWK05_06925 [Pyrobaculum sp.]
MEFIVPLCSRWEDFEEATFVVREGAVLAVGRTPGGFDERVVELGSVAAFLKPYQEIYDFLASELGRAFGVDYRPDYGDVFSWLRSHVSFIDAVGARWGRTVDRLGPFSVRRLVKEVYMPYSGHALTLTYVAYPFQNAVVAAENKGRAMAIGSVVVEWGGVKVASAGLRTLAGAVLLAQAASELLEELRSVKKAVEEFVARFRAISACR